VDSTDHEGYLTPTSLKLLRNEALTIGSNREETYHLLGKADLLQFVQIFVVLINEQEWMILIHGLKISQQYCMSL
jgi:hypothetical protein